MELELKDIKMERLMLEVTKKIGQVEKGNIITQMGTITRETSPMV